MPAEFQGERTPVEAGSAPQRNLFHWSHAPTPEPKLAPACSAPNQAHTPAITPNSDSRKRKARPGAAKKRQTHPTHGSRAP